MRHWYSMGLLALAAACRPNLDLPDEGAISCRSNSDCPEPRVCQPRISRCVDELDDDAPEVLGATAIDAITVVVTVAEELLAVAPEHLLISTAQPDERLAVLAVDTSPDGLTLSVTTQTQLPGVSYVVDLASLTDLQGNAPEPSSASFRGFGGAPDTTAPQTLLPAENSRVIVGSEHRPIDLIWTARAGASAYTIQVHDSPDFSSQVASFVVGRDQVSVQFTPLAPVTYYWRVRADVTLDGVFAESQFSVVEDALHVYCAPGPDCSRAAGPELGDRDFPFRSIARALTTARAERLSMVNVASRGGEAYAELLVPAGGITLRGGFEADFDEATRDVVANPTMVRVPGTVLYIGNAALPITIDGLRFVSQLLPGLPAAAQQLTVASVNGAASLVTFSRCVLETEPGAGAAIVLAVATAPGGEVLVTDGSTIHARAPLTQSIGMALAVGASATVDGGSVIEAEGPTAATGELTCNGVMVQPEATLMVRDATVRASPRDFSASVFALGGTIDIDASELEVIAGGHGPVLFAVAFGGTTSITVTRSRLSCPECSGLPVAAVLWGTSSTLAATLVNNLLLVDADVADEAYGIMMNGDPRLTLVHNTIVVGGAPATLLQITGGSPVLTNNLFVCGSSGGRAIDERSSFAVTDPASFEGNTIVGCDEPYRNESDASILVTGAAIDALDGGEIAGATCTGCQHSRYSANRVSTIAAPLFFESGVAAGGRVDTTAAMQPSAAAALDVGGGKLTGGNDCGALEAPVSCGNVLDDFAGSTRASPPSRGAVEALP
jgi:hypothetical protein